MGSEGGSDGMLLMGGGAKEEAFRDGAGAVTSDVLLAGGELAASEYVEGRD